MENIENVNNLTIETIYKMVLEMKSKLDFLESETHVLQSDKTGSYMEGIEPRLGNLETDTADIKIEIAVMKADIERIKLRLDKIETDIVEMKVDIKGIELRLGKVETDIENIKDDIVDIKDDISEMRKEIAKISSDQSKFRDDVYKWGVALMIGMVVSVSSIISMAVMLVN